MSDRLQRRFWHTLFLAPTILIFVFVFFIPVIDVVVSSFYEWKLLVPKHFVGFDNYNRLLTVDLDFKVAVKNTLWWVFLQSTLHVGFGSAVALALYKRPFGWKFVRTSYFIPNVVSVAAKGLLFLNLFNPQYGPINAIIRIFNPGFEQNWFFDHKTALFTVQLGWLIYAGMITVILFSEIVNIPEQLFEAARLDGATGRQIDFKIVIPLLRNAVGTCVLISATSMLKEFEFIYITTKGGPGNLTMNLPLLVYKSAMINNNYGYANAVGTLLIIAGLLTVFLISRLFRFGQSDY